MMVIRHIAITQRVGFLYSSIFLMLLFAYPSPKAKGVPHTMGRPVERESREAEYSFFTSFASFLMTASSQAISMSLPERKNASHTSGLNQWMQRTRKLTGLTTWSN